MINSLYGKYFQKSKTFLFPVLGIKKSAKFQPTGVYLTWKNKYTSTDNTLVVVYKKEDSEAFRSFEQTNLLSNPLFIDDDSTKDGFGLYVFDLATIKKDMNHFRRGSYSRFSNTLKKFIREHYGENSSEYKYIDTYLYPDRYFDLYAKLLNVEVHLLEEVGELCDPYDQDKEELKIEVEDLELSKKAL